jgi:hypothetical protein
LQLLFNQPWADYVSGFGQVDTEFFIGLSSLASLTNSEDYELSVEMWTEDPFGDTYAEARYGSFKIADAANLYRLQVDGFVQPNLYGLRDEMSASNGAAFSSTDMDHSGGNCTLMTDYKAAGW